MKVITKSVRERIPYNLINIIWIFYEEGYNNLILDDYQFFKIEQLKNKTTLKMWQEDPKAMKIKSIPHFEECEIWIINDGDVSTMLFPEEY